MNIRPTPGHWNTVSVMIAKAMIEPSWSPVMVITGTSVFLSAWPKLTMRLGRAPARATLLESGGARGGGELDVVGAQHLQHLGTHQPHDEGELEKRQRRRREEEGAQPVAG